MPTRKAVGMAPGTRRDFYCNITRLSILYELARAIVYVGKKT